MATELAKAYVQVVPSAEGIKGKLSNIMGQEGDAAGRKGGENAGNSFASTIKKLIVAAGIGSVIKSALSQGADFEQLTGGVETLFQATEYNIETMAMSMQDAGYTIEEIEAKTYAMAHANDIVMQNAANAYKTAGLSANDYMETVTSFSASLLQSLAGDTEEAAQVADMAITDMADNANKMGSSMESIQNAYQGFAKQNYTMLDNLKLGYGGTKEEMQRLLDDATKLSGVEYDMSNLNDVYQAIHVVQTELGITGTTAKEASVTVSGSLASMKSAWQNVLTMIASGQDAQAAIDGLVESVLAFAGNIVPMIKNVVLGLLPAIGQIFQELAPILVTDILPAVLDIMTGLATQLATLLPVILPVIIQTIVDLINAIAQVLPTLLPELIPVVIQGLVDIGLALLDNLPLLIASIFECMLVIGQTLYEMLADLWNNTIGPWLSDVFASVGEWFSGVISSVGEWFSGIFKAIGDFFANAWASIKDFFAQAVQKVVSFFVDIVSKVIAWRDNVTNTIKTFFANMWSSIVEWFAKILGKVVDFVKSIPQKIRDGIAKVTQVGLDLVKGLWNGISNATQWVLDKIKGFGQSILNGIKRIFGIGSPSKEMAYFGEMLDAGLAQGIEGNTKPISNAIDGITDMTTKGFSSNIGVSGSYDVNTQTSGMGQLIAMVASLAEKVDHLQVYLDGDTLVGGISERMDNALGASNVRKARGLA